MRIGIGLPAAVPGASATDIGRWAARGEQAGFHALGVIDRLVYDSLDPVVALAAAAACTRRIGLYTTVLNVGYRPNPLVTAKQLASLDLIAGGRLTAGLALGGWPADHAASGTPPTGRGAAFDAALTAMREFWDGRVTGAAGPAPALPAGRPTLLLGGLVPAAYRRVAAFAEGWVAPSFGFETLTSGMAAVREAWDTAGREGSPRVTVERYFCLGPGADDAADAYLHHYYGTDYFPHVRADTPTTPDTLSKEIARLADTGCDDLVLFPCTGDLDQIDRLAEILDTELAHPTGR
ncbi:LLM class flavin-dependent oxidoreductase [Embleya hyalina]|uniref:Monooxygenase n=1 Tax=Embleya hyalina TaxID=516124 RepID=A0A401YNF0_9ACTN|nr:LLM class flavin-dependent oxidoreductase [Embleya hyalina]GCD96144.1 monooxygenase [Embleya hyalina]